MLNNIQSEKSGQVVVVQLPPPPQAAMCYLKCFLGSSLDEQKLCSAPLKFIRNALYSQELILSDKLLFLIKSL